MHPNRYFLLALLLWLLSPGVAWAQQPTTQPSAAELEQERQRWNNSLTRDTAYGFSREPNALLMQVVKSRKPGKALDVGMGQGRNSLYLARQGWDVTGLDVADEAVAQAREQAKREKLKLNAVVAPMETFDFGTNRYDLVAFVYEGCFEQPQVLANLKQALKPGGVMVFEFFHRDAGLAMNRPDFGCPTGAIKALFEKDPRFRIVRYEEKMGRPDFWGNAKRANQPMKLVYCVVQRQ